MFSLIGSSKSDDVEGSPFEFFITHQEEMIIVGIVLSLITNFWLLIFRNWNLVVGLELQDDLLIITTKNYRKKQTQTVSFQEDTVDLKKYKSSKFIFVPTFLGYELLHKGESIGHVLLDHDCWNKNSTQQKKVLMFLGKLTNSKTPYY